MRYCLSMDAQWLKTQFTLNPDKAKADLAKALGLEPPAVSKIINGTRQIKAQEYAAMRRFFGLPVDGEHAIMRQMETAYALRTLEKADGMGKSEDNHDSSAEWVIPANVLSGRTQAPPEKIRMFQVKESVMEPDFKQGEHVLVDLSDHTPSPPGVFIVSDGYGHMIRQCAFIPKSYPPEVKISARSDGFVTQTLNPDEFTIVGRVIAKLQMV